MPLAPNLPLRILPSDEIDLPFLPNRVHVTGGGSLRILHENGDYYDFPAVPDDTVMCLNPVRILATGTTCTGLSVYVSDPCGANRDDGSSDATSEGSQAPDDEDESEESSEDPGEEEPTSSSSAAQGEEESSSSAAQGEEEEESSSSAAQDEEEQSSSSAVQDEEESSSSAAQGEEEQSSSSAAQDEESSSSAAGEDEEDEPGSSSSEGPIAGTDPASLAELWVEVPIAGGRSAMYAHDDQTGAVADGDLVGYVGPVSPTVHSIVTGDADRPVFEDGQGLYINATKPLYVDDQDLPTEVTISGACLFVFAGERLKGDNQPVFFGFDSGAEVRIIGSNEGSPDTLEITVDGPAASIAVDFGVTEQYLAFLWRDGNGDWYVRTGNSGDTFIGNMPGTLSIDAVGGASTAGVTSFLRVTGIFTDFDFPDDREAFNAFLGDLLGVDWDSGVNVFA